LLIFTRDQEVVAEVRLAAAKKHTVVPVETPQELITMLVRIREGGALGSTALLQDDKHPSNDSRQSSLYLMQALSEGFHGLRRIILCTPRESLGPFRRVDATLSKGSVTPELLEAALGWVNADPVGGR
jgi:hypothetical protein